MKHTSILTLKFCSTHISNIWCVSGETRAQLARAVPATSYMIFHFRGYALRSRRGSPQNSLDIIEECDVLSEEVGERVHSKLLGESLAASAECLRLKY